MGLDGEALAARLVALNPSVAQDSLWQHSTSAWLTSAGALVGIGLVCVGLTAIKLFRQTSKT